MVLADEGHDPVVVRAAVRNLMRESDELPTAHALLVACRIAAAEESVRDMRCPLCGSEKVAGRVGGPAVCFDCVWEGTL